MIPCAQFEGFMTESHVNKTVLYKQQSILVVDLQLQFIIMCHLLLLKSWGMLICNLGIYKQRILENAKGIMTRNWYISKTVYLMKPQKNLNVYSVYPGYSVFSWRWNTIISRDPESIKWYKRRKKLSLNLKNYQWINDLLTSLIQQKVDFTKLSTLEKAQQFYLHSHKSKL